MNVIRTNVLKILPIYLNINNKPPHIEVFVANTSLYEPSADCIIL